MNDWEVISEEAYLENKQKAAEQTVDPRLAKLSELLSDNAEEEITAGWNMLCM